MRTPLRHCDTCRCGEIRGEALLCAHNHKPPFIVPGWEEISSGEWGWMRRCRDYKPDDKELERLAQERRELSLARLQERRRKWAATALFIASNPFLPRSE